MYMKSQVISASKRVCCRDEVGDVDGQWHGFCLHAGPHKLTNVSAERGEPRKGKAGSS